MRKAKVSLTNFKVTNGFKLINFHVTYRGWCLSQLFDLIMHWRMFKLLGKMNHHNNTMCHAQGKGHFGQVQGHKWIQTHKYSFEVQTVVLVSTQRLNHTWKDLKITWQNESLWEHKMTWGRQSSSSSRSHGFKDLLANIKVTNEVQAHTCIFQGLYI